MKIEVSFEKFKDAVLLAAPITVKHPTLPVLSCVLMDIKKNSISLKATNLDMGITITIPAKTDGEGKVAIPAQIVSSFISQSPIQDKAMTLDIVSGNVNITAMKSKVVIKSMPADDFPDMPEASGDHITKLPSEAFMKGLKAVSYSASISSVKPELSSVYVYKTDKKLTFVATDSFRLAEKKVETPSLPANFPDILIPLKNIGGIVRFLEHAGGDVDMSTDKNLMSCSTPGAVLVSRIIDGVFPDYRQIIPKGFSTEAVVLKHDLTNALKLSNIFSDSFNLVRLVIDPKTKHFEVHTRNNDVGENDTFVDAALTGDRMEINFNYKYVTDCLQSIDADSMSLQLGGSNKPMVIRPVSGDQSFMYLVMPMNR